ncbi:MAG: C10 family peptidase [Prevotella sp.]|nr:C10 family peptidase [Candidatus Prevotella equi]
MRLKSFSLLVLVISFVSSCTNNNYEEVKMFENGDRYAVSITSEEAISLIADYSNNLSDTEVIQLVESFVCEQEPSTRATELNLQNVRIVKNYRLSCDNINLTRAGASTDSVDFCEIIFDCENNSGYAYVCRDSRYPEVLAFVPCIDYSSLNSYEPINIMIDRAQSVALKYIERCNEISHNLHEQTLSKVCKNLHIARDEFDFVKYRKQIHIEDYDYANDLTRGSVTTPTGTILNTVGPLCGSTRIIQGWPCNQFMPTTELEKFNTMQHNGHYPAGCANVALATICAYIQPTIYSADLGRNINWANVYNTYFNPFAFNEVYYSSNTPQAIEVGYLLKTIANGTNTNFDSNGGGTSISNAASYMRSIGISMSSSTSALNYSNVRQSLSNLSPVYCTGTNTENGSTRSDSNSSNHAWVIDGLQIRRPNTRMEIQNYNCYANCKFGWIENEYYGGYNGWYLFDTNGTISFDFDSSSLSSNLRCVTNIRIQ